MDTNRDRPTELPGSEGNDDRRRAPAPAPKRKRASKRRLRVLAGLAAGASFALPWAVLRAVPVPPRPNAMLAPRGTVVILPGHGSRPGAAHSKAVHPAGRPVAVTRASGVPPP